MSYNPYIAIYSKAGGIFCAPKIRSLKGVATITATISAQKFLQKNTNRAKDVQTFILSNVRIFLPKTKFNVKIT